MKRISFAFNANQMLGFWFFYFFICFTLSSAAYAQQIIYPQDPSTQGFEQRLESLRPSFHYRNNDLVLKKKTPSPANAKQATTSVNYIGEIKGEKFPLFPGLIDSDPAGNVFIYDSWLDEILRYNSAGILEGVIPICENPTSELYLIQSFSSRPFFSPKDIAIDNAGENLYILGSDGRYHYSVIQLNISTGLLVAEFGNEILGTDTYGNTNNIDLDNEGNVYVLQKNVLRKFSNNEFIENLALPFPVGSNTWFKKLLIYNNIFFVTDFYQSGGPSPSYKVHIFNNEEYFSIPASGPSWVQADSENLWLMNREGGNILTKYRYDLLNHMAEKVHETTFPSYNHLLHNPTTHEFLTVKKDDPYQNGDAYSVHRIDLNGNELGQFYPTNRDEISVPMKVYFDGEKNIIVGDALYERFMKYDANYHLIERISAYDVSAENIYTIKDSNNNRYKIDGFSYDMIKVNSTGDVLYTIDLAVATFSAPVFDLILDPSENYLYFIQQEYSPYSYENGSVITYTRIKKYSATTGTYIGDIGIQGTNAGQYQHLTDIDIDSDGNIFAADIGRKCIHVFSKEGVYLRKIGEPGVEEGQFRYPSIIKTTKNDHLLVLDDTRKDVQVFDINGTWMTKFGGYGDSGENFLGAYSMEVGPDNRIYVSDFYGSRVLIFEEESNPLTLISSTQTGRKNRTILYPITTHSFSNVVSTQFTVTWDPTAVTYAGLSSFGLPGMGENSFGIAQVDDGKLVVSWTAPNLAPQTLADNTTLFSINFTLMGTPGTSTPLTIDGSVVPIEIIGSNLAEVEYETVAGSIRIEEPITLIEGTITHHSQPLALTTVDIFRTLWHRPMATDANGHYSESVAPGFNYTITASRVTDTSAYGSYLNAADLAAIRRHILQVAPFTSPYEKIAADVNDSGNISTLDIVLTEAALLGILPTLPNGGRWKFVPADFVFDPTAPFQHPHSKTVLNVTADVTQDFVAVHLGDVVNSNAATGRVASRYILEMTPILTESELSVVVKGNGFADVSALQVALQWDDSYLDYIGIEGNAISPRINAVDHTLRLIWDEANGKSMNLADGTVLFTLRFHTKTQNRNYETSLTLSTELEAAGFNTYLQSGSISTQWVEEEGHTFKVGVPYPNPSGSSFNLDVTLTEAAEVAFTFIDVQGKTLNSYTQQCEQGLNKLIIRATDTDSKGTGIYLLKIEVGVFSKIVKVAKEK